MRFSDKVLFATGGGSGIAAAVARRFTAEGGRVAVADLDGDRARAVAAELDGAVGLACDVADEESVRAALAAAEQQLGGIDAVLSAAGHAEFGPIEQWSLERWNRMMLVHAGGTFLVCKHALPLLRRRGGGSIVTVASVAALVAQRDNAPYGAAKAAVLGFTRQLALEVGPQVRVNALAPGRTRSGMTEPIILARGDGDLERGSVAFGAGTIQRRVAEPDEQAAAACFLLSDDAGFVTGATLVVDGGETVV
ncbi:SDR family NAD(P)-dependent oxidoreductase [Goekera deserti]|uniref:SDR family oxidoreductase n=1 Tax=Goekera deserti TaxID=2497753 RepID=A0A7K3WGE2_9ACTN|nr:SDR family NAD(P)-dependent oxidoreductase [Goekera deserti]NDI47164.1 SDR family oxidoreductase [Goekera deserti]NEL55436.1 SDR family oxidoreductase [Goekera deserti]